MSLESLVISNLRKTFLSPINSLYVNCIEGPILILDDFTLVIFNNYFKQFDLYENAIFGVTQIHLKRDPMPNRCAIYFICYNEENVKLLANDFSSENKVLYKNCHVLWAEPIVYNPKMLQPITKCNTFLKRNLSFVENPVAFAFVGNNCISLALNDFFKNVYVQLGDKKNNQGLNYQISTYVNRLVGFLQIIECKPRVRYVLQNANERNLCKSTALALDEYFDLVNKDFKNVAEVLIVDRTIDLNNLFLHDYSFEALTYDLLNIPDNTFSTKLNKKNHSTVEIKDELTDKTLSYKFDNSEKLISEIRYLHIQETVEKLRMEVQEFTRRNEHNKFKQEDGYEDVYKIISSLPKYKEDFEIFDKCLRTANLLLSKIRDLELLKISEIEQDIATGFNEKGKLINTYNVLNEISKVMSANEAVYDEIKVRLLLLYFMNFNGITDEDASQIINNSNLSLKAKETIQAYLSLKLHQTVVSTPNNNVKHNHVILGNKEKQSFYEKHIPKCKYHLSRFVSDLEQVSNSFVNNTLSLNLYPCTKNIVNNNHNLKKSAVLISNTTKWDWSDDKSTIAAASQTQYFIIAMLGPVTHADIAMIYEIGKKVNKNIIIVASNVCSPKSFLEMLQK